MHLIIQRLSLTAHGLVAGETTPTHPPHVIRVYIYMSSCRYLTMGLHHPERAESAAHSPPQPPGALPPPHPPKPRALFPPAGCCLALAIGQVLIWQRHFYCHTHILSYRFDFARIDKKCLKDFVRSPSQITLLGGTLGGGAGYWVGDDVTGSPYAVLFCVLLALIVTLSVAAIDERVTLYYQHPALW